ncbi:hypothetical protein OsI_11012 [Oryza sativa Indica Group]|uniref:BHLH domain-containing protein n=1 Tax=Oryza sativa subsp. indica TaxID=39946 RepID=B8AL35_ORYSI|nr:hypothetical protein OsI_11012 [Oryza sativa Indica Group]
MVIASNKHELMKYLSLTLERLQKQQLCRWIRHDDLDMLTDELERKRYRTLILMADTFLANDLRQFPSAKRKASLYTSTLANIFILMLKVSSVAVKCEASNSPSTTVGFDRMIAADYDLFHHMSFSPSLQNLQSPTFFTTRSSESYLGESSIYGGGARPALAQFSYSQPIAATSAAHLVRWTAAGEPMTGDGGFRSSKRLKTATTATTQPPRHGVKCHAKPRNQTTKATCKKRSQKLGDRITALQQLVSPYGKTDTASVLHEAAACIRQLHQQIQILTAPYPGTSSSSASSQQQVVFSVLESCSHVMSFFTAIATVLWLQDAGGGGGTATELRRRGLCVAALSPAVVSLAAEGGRRRTDVEDQKRIWFSNQ